MIRIVTLAALLVALPSAAYATCGERGGPGCRLPNGRCASCAEAAYCRAHSEALEAPAPGLDKGQVINDNLKRPLVALPIAPGAIIIQRDPAESAALDRWIAAQPDPTPSRQEAISRLIAQALTKR
jgi:hypothetical protein